MNPFSDTDIVPSGDPKENSKIHTSIYYSFRCNNIEVKKLSSKNKYKLKIKCSNIKQCSYTKDGNTIKKGNKLNKLMSKYSSLYPNVLTFILLKLKENGEINSCQDDKYIPLAIHFIMNKYFHIIEIMCDNGFIVSGNNDYLQIAIKTRSFNLIKVLITFGADISSHDYAVLHYALKQKTTKLLIFIKEKLTVDNKLQEYIDWETNPEYKIRFDKT